MRRHRQRKGFRCSMADELTAWRCKNGHALGMARKTGRGHHQLILYRHAVDLSAEKPEQVEVIAVIRGQGIDIRCDICEEKRTWAVEKKLPVGRVPEGSRLKLKAV